MGGLHLPPGVHSVHHHPPPGHLHLPLLQRDEMSQTQDSSQLVSQSPHCKHGLGPQLWGPGKQSNSLRMQNFKMSSVGDFITCSDDHECKDDFPNEDNLGN